MVLKRWWSGSTAMASTSRTCHPSNIVHLSNNMKRTGYCGKIYGSSIPKTRAPRPPKGGLVRRSFHELFRGLIRTEVEVHGSLHAQPHMDTQTHLLNFWIASFHCTNQPLYEVQSSPKSWSLCLSSISKIIQPHALRSWSWRFRKPTALIFKSIWMTWIHPYL